MINDVEIFNFKCFESLYLPELSRMNIVGGENNVGKTALLEALFIFHHRDTPGMFLNTVNWRGVPVVPSDPGSLWAPFFNGFDVHKTIAVKLNVDGKAASAEYRLDLAYRPPPQERAGSGEKGGAPDHVSTAEEDRSYHSLDITYADPDGRKARGHLYVLDGELHLHLEQKPSTSQPVAIIPTRRREPPQELARRLSRLIEEKRESLAEEFLSIIAPVRDLQVSTSTPVPSIICDIGLQRLVPLAYAGDGMTRLLTIILAMREAQGGLLLIDEIENGIHYSVQQAFMKAVGEASKKLNCQVIATTHSYELLRNAHAGLGGLFEPEFRYIRLEKNGEETTAKTFNHEMLGAAIDANLEVR